MKKLGLIGFPLSHSFSKKYFTEKFEKAGITDYSYDLYPIDDINKISSVLQQDLIGLNVTIPYKEKVIPFLNEISEEADKIGAVNVIQIRYIDNKYFLKGFNSDYFGFYESLKPLLKKEHRKALILGTGGASKAVAYALQKLDIQYTFVSRKKTNEQILTYAELTNNIIDKTLLIINTTPLGMYPNIDKMPDIPYQHITKHHICYDLVYNPEKTKFLETAKNKGATIKNGLEMLILQAEHAWQIWNEF